MIEAKIKTTFEIKEETPETVVYQRVFKQRKGRSKKDIETILSHQPTATVHVLSMERYTKLKRIESELYKSVNEDNIKNQTKKTLLQRALASFLAI
jgi:hypothetical protein